MPNMAIPPITERRRIAAPRPLPQGLALGHGFVWLSFRDGDEIVRFDLDSRSLEHACNTPGTAWGLTSDGTTLWAVCGLGPDEDRHILAFDMAGRPIGEPLPCPAFTGSYLAYHGETVYLSQWYEKRVFRVDGGAFVQVASTPSGICGLTAVGSRLALLCTDDEDTDDYFLCAIDPHDAAAAPAVVARVGFPGRSLAWTGERFLTNHRVRGEIVEFEAPFPG